MWAEVSKPCRANAKFRLHCGKQRVVARFWSKAKQRWLARVLALAYGAAGFSSSGSVGCRGVSVSQMLKEALRQFPAGQELMVDEFSTSRAEVHRLRDVEQSLMGTVDGLQGDLDDLQATHQGLQGTTLELAVPVGAPPQQQQQLAAASTSRKREAPAANKPRAAKQGATHSSVAKRARAARLAWGEFA
ncbi:hypothetical protein QJQ45_002647 [Haematococcus lacustris]|nr:hypothetical protein QJQ45_002647 [Haematococcus lacustris]